MNNWIALCPSLVSLLKIIKIMEIFKMAEETHDIRDILLKAAGQAFLYKHLSVDDGEDYFGEEAVEKGFDLIAMVQHFDREFAYKKEKKNNN